MLATFSTDEGERVGFIIIFTIVLMSVRLFIALLDRSSDRQRPPD
jgi:hypothetical protein